MLLRFTVTHVSLPSAIFCKTHLIFLSSHLLLNTMSFVLFWRCIVFSEKCSSFSFPLTSKLCSPSFSFPPFLPLPSSLSSCFTPPLNIISDLLRNECGFSSSQVTTVMRRHPQLLRTKSDLTARKVILLLKDSGFTENRLKTIILRYPTIILLKVDSQLKPKMEFLEKMGLPAQDIAHIIYRRPSLLGLSLENCLAPRILHLETLFGSRFHLCKALRIAPELLISDFKKQVIPRVEYVKNKLGILEGSAAFARAVSVVLNLSLENMEKKTKHMASLGLGEEEISKILKIFPEALISSTKKMTGNIDFLIRTAGLDPKIVACHPSLLKLSVEKRLKPRYEVFESLRTSLSSKRLPSLLRFFGLSEQEFIKRFGRYSDKSIPTIIQSPKQGF